MLGAVLLTVTSKRKSGRAWTWLPPDRHPAVSVRLPRLRSKGNTGARRPHSSLGSQQKRHSRSDRASGLARAPGSCPGRGRNLKGRCVTFTEREKIAVARAGGESMRSIARRLGRSPSTISRELSRNTGRAGCYRATTAHAQEYVRASRPKPAKLVTHLELRRKVEEDLRRRYSPEQIVGRLRRQFPDDPEMRVSPRRSTNRCASSPAARCGAI
jgi:hypothetical protein